MTDANPQPDSERLSDMVRELLDLTEESAEIGRQHKAAKAAMRAKEAEVWEFLEEHETKTQTLELGGRYGNYRITRVSKFKGNITDKEALQAHLEEQGMTQEVYRPKLHQQALDEYLKDLLETEAEIPEGLDFFEKRTVQKTRV